MVQSREIENAVELQMVRVRKFYGRRESRVVALDGVSLDSEMRDLGVASAVASPGTPLNAPI